MSAAKFLLCVLLLAGACQSQQPADKPATKSGCLQSLNGAFVLISDNGERITLKGDHDSMFGYIGKQVRVSGTLKAQKKHSSKPAEMQVSDVKKLADACQ